MFVSRFASLPHTGHLQFTQSSMSANGDSPVPVGSYFSTYGNVNGNSSSGTGTAPQSGQ